MKIRGQLTLVRQTTAARRGCPEDVARAAVLRNGHRARPQAQGGRVRRALDELVVTVERTRTIVTPAPDRETKGTAGAATARGARVTRSQPTRCDREDAPSSARTSHRVGTGQHGPGRPTGTRSLLVR
jgi:hypothetical protein